MSIRTRVPVSIRDGIPTEMVSFDLEGQDGEDIALLFTGWDKADAPLVRVHSECLTGDVFGSRRCDCGPQLDEAIRRMAEDGGILIYLRQEGRGIGLYNKLDAYRLQIEEGADTFAANIHLGLPVDSRDYRVAAQMLQDLGVSRVRLLTNNPDKVRGLEAAGVAVAEVIPTGVHTTEDNRSYLQAKRAHGHLLSGAGSDDER